MLFPTATFAIFFAIVFGIYWAIPERSVFRKWALLAASVFFYVWWSWKFAIMMLVSAAVNHALALYLARDKGRKPALVMAVALNLALLAFFKYSRFLFLQCFHPLALLFCEQFGDIESLYELDETVLPFIDAIVLPVGISFYTFQAISYVVDVAAGKCKPAASFLDFANYLSFFPKLAAGPIVRASDLLPQMETLPSRGTEINTGRAATLILGGLFKKMVVANWLSQKLADPVFTSPEEYGAIDTLLGVYGYTIQIYCDFSAYSDIATGCALLLGFKFPDNFRAPYIATSLQDFWRRWHITLSTWLRDYLYIPMGGSRCAKWRIYHNLVMTMLLGGLWHGAGWTYIIWGAIHGVAQVLERPFNRKRLPGENGPSFGVQLLRGFLTFHIVAFAWIFFRAGAADAAGMETVNTMLSAFSNWSAPATLLSSTAMVMLLLGFALQVLDGDTPKRAWAFFNRLHPLAQGAIAALILTVILGLGPAGVAPFVYFQF